MKKFERMDDRFLMITEVIDGYELMDASIEKVCRDWDETLGHVTHRYNELLDAYEELQRAYEVIKEHLRIN